MVHYEELCAEHRNFLGGARALFILTVHEWIKSCVISFMSLINDHLILHKPHQVHDQKHCSSCVPLPDNVWINSS